jgi:uncharacterized membrane protein YbhN (UPF0104 family)
MRNSGKCDQSHIRSGCGRVQIESVVIWRGGKQVVGNQQASSDLGVLAIDRRAVARKVVLPALFAVLILALVLLGGSRVHSVSHALRQVFDLSPGWMVVALVFETLSLAGYVALMSLVMGTRTPRVGVRASAQVTLAGVAATRLLPTAGAGGAALTLWTLRRAGLQPRAATRTLVAFFVVLYSVFLAAIVLSGAALSLGWVDAGAPTAISAIPAMIALVGIVACSMLARGRVIERDATRGAEEEEERSGWRERVHAIRQVLGQAVRDGRQLVASHDPRLLGAVAYWLFDAAVLWAMLHAFGSSPALPVVALAYLVGQVANTVPLPGSVSGGTVGLLIALGCASEVALPAVLAYRAVSVWLPTPAALAAIPRLRNTIARWRREDEQPEASVARPDFSRARARLESPFTVAA